MKIRTLILAALILVLSGGNSFAQDDINVYTVAMTEAHTETVRQNPFVSPTLSGNAGLALNPAGPIADLVIGVTAGNVGGTPDVPRHNIYAYKITDPCSLGYKTKVVLDTGNHNTETPGSWAFQGMVDFLIGSESQAAWLRQHAVFYVYPLVNPDGRYTGTGRGNPEMTAEGFGIDHNRVWNTQGQGLSTIDALTTAMQTDTEGDADYLFDFHSAVSASSSYFYTTQELMDSPFVQAFLELGIEGVGPVVSAGKPGMARIWAMTAEGLNVEYGYTPESDHNQNVNYYLDLGRSYGIALHNTLICDLTDLATLSSHWLDNNLVPQPAGELFGHWRLDETAGATAADASGNGPDGTLHNGPIWRSGGRFGGALSFDEVDDHVIIPDFDYTNSLHEFSLSFWFKIDDVTGSYYQYMFSHGDVSENNSLNVYFRESGSDAEKVTSKIILNNGTSRYLHTPDVLADGQWHMYTFTLSSENGANVYIDANSVLNDPDLKGALFNPETDIYLGGRCDLNSDRFYGHVSADDGLLDEVRLYNYALSPDEIALVYEDLPVPPPPVTLLCSTNPPGDQNGDCRVDLFDYLILSSRWIK